MACRLQNLLQMKILLLSSGWLCFEVTEILRKGGGYFSTYFHLPNSSAVNSLILFQNSLFILRFPRVLSSLKTSCETVTSSLGTQDILACICFILLDLFKILLTFQTHKTKCLWLSDNCSYVVPWNREFLYFKDGILNVIPGTLVICTPVEYPSVPQNVFKVLLPLKRGSKHLEKFCENSLCNILCKRFHNS